CLAGAGRGCRTGSPCRRPVSAHHGSGPSTFRGPGSTRCPSGRSRQARRYPGRGPEKAVQADSGSGGRPPGYRAGTRKVRLSAMRCSSHPLLRWRSRRQRPRLVSGGQMADGIRRRRAFRRYPSIYGDFILGHQVGLAARARLALRTDMITPALEGQEEEGRAAECETLPEVPVLVEELAVVEKAGCVQELTAVRNTQRVDDTL